MLARVEFEGEERVRAGVRAGQGRAVRHRALRLLGAAGDGARAAAASRWRCWRARSTTARSNDLLERMRTRTGNSVIYRQGTIRRVMRHAAGRAGRRHPDRSAHPEPRRDLRGFLRPAGGDDVGGRRAGAANRRAGRAAVRAAARRRPLSDDLRASGRAAARGQPSTRSSEFTQRCTDVLEMYVRRHPELWLWMHRRWRDDRRGRSPECRRHESRTRDVELLHPRASDRQIVRVRSARRSASASRCRTRGR